MHNFAYIGNDNLSSDFLNLIIDKYPPTYIITGNDRIAGRGRKITHSPLVPIAEKYNIPYYKTNNPNDEAFINKLRDLQKINYFIVFSFGYYLKNDFLSIPMEMSINIHPSLLPKYRGATPINSVIINGEKETGVSFYKMTNKMDAGPIIMQKKIYIKENMTSIELRHTVIDTAYHIFEEYDWKHIVLQEQNDGNATYTHKIDKKILFYKEEYNAKQLTNLINGLSEYGIKAKIKDRNIKLRQASLIENSSHNTPGIIAIDNNKIKLSCNKGTLFVEKIQPEGKKIMNSKDFINGYKIKNGEELCAVYSE